jgi:hypothetical protein
MPFRTVRPEPARLSSCVFLASRPVGETIELRVSAAWYLLHTSRFQGGRKANGWHPIWQFAGHFTARGIPIPDHLVRTIASLHSMPIFSIALREMRFALEDAESRRIQAGMLIGRLTGKIGILQIFIILRVECMQSQRATLPFSGLAGAPKRPPRPLPPPSLRRAPAPRSPL